MNDIKLTNAQEFIFNKLLGSIGEVVKYEDLIIPYVESEKVASVKTLCVQIGSIRKQTKSVYFIKSIKGVGYLMVKL